MENFLHFSDGSVRLAGAGVCRGELEDEVEQMACSTNAQAIADIAVAKVLA